MEFQGWSDFTHWEEVKIDLSHPRSVERVALAGNKAWKRGMAAFCRPFASAEVRYFVFADAARACDWIAEGLLDVAPRSYDGTYSRD